MVVMREQMNDICMDLKKKMVFVVGPRQAGKTWLAKEIARSYRHALYLNYDQVDDRGVVHAQAWPEETELLVIDECHKMPGWKQYLKGVYDTKPSHLQILVTGSAKLNTFRQAGDSLVGRFFCHRLLPLTLAELQANDQVMPLHHLLARGGYPEPLLAERLVDANRWRDQYLDGILTTDVQDFGGIADVRYLKLLVALLRERVGSPVSYQSLARDLGCAVNTVKKYLEWLENLYVVFRVQPHARNVARSLEKAPKIYFYDQGLVKGDAGAKFENFVALSLLKETWLRQDRMAEPVHLAYLRTRDGREVDFAWVHDQTLKALIEVKHADATWSRHLRYFSDRLAVPGYQVVQNVRLERQEGRLQLRKGESFLSNLHQAFPAEG